MAENKRRGEEPADEQFDDVDAAPDGANDDGRADAVADTETDGEVRVVGAEGRDKRDTGKVGLFGRLGRFFREIVAELRKVIWPTRNELITYTMVVIVFVSIVTAIVVGLDYGFAKAVLALFGTKN